MKKHLSFWIFSLLILPAVNAQVEIELKTVIHQSGGEEISVKGEPDWTFTDSTLLWSRVNEFMEVLQFMGYLAAGIVQVIRMPGNFLVIINAGERYQWVQLTVDSVLNPFIEKAGFRPNDFITRPFEINRLESLQEKILIEAGNSGYPFAEVFLDKIDIQGGKISAELRGMLHQRVLIDSIRVIGDGGVSENFLGNYLGLREGAVYNE